MRQQTQRFMQVATVLFMGAVAVVYFVAAGPVQPACIPFKLQTAANTNPTLIVSGKHNLVAATIATNSAGSFFVKFYDLARAPNVGTDTPNYVFGVGNVTGTTQVTFPLAPMDFETGLAMGTALNLTDADATNITATNQQIDVCWL